MRRLGVAAGLTSKGWNVRLPRRHGGTEATLRGEDRLPTAANEFRVSVAKKRSQVRLHAIPKSFTLSQLHSDKQSAQAGRLTLWPLPSGEECCRSSSHPAPKVRFGPVARELSRGLALFVCSFPSKR